MLGRPDGKMTVIRGAQDAAGGQKPAQCPLRQDALRPGTRSGEVR